MPCAKLSTFDWCLTPEDRQLREDAARIVADLDLLDQQAGAFSIADGKPNLPLIKFELLVRPEKSLLSQVDLAFLETVPAMRAMLDERLADLPLTRGAASSGIAGGPAILEGVLYDALVARQLAEKLRTFETTGFEEAVRREIDREGWRLGHMQDLIREKAGDFDAKQLFRDMALAKGHLLSNHPVIVPDCAALYQTPPHGEWPWMLTSGTFKFDQKISGMNFGFGFAERRLEVEGPLARNEDRTRSVWYPLLVIDRQVFDFLQEAAGLEPDSGGKGGAGRGDALSVLKGIRSLTSLGGHDYIHQMIYGIGSQSQDRSYFCNDNAPLLGREVESDAIAGTFNRDLARKQHYSSTEVETFSALLHRDVWTQAYEAQPEVQAAVLRVATAYLESVDRLSQLALERHGPEFAERFASYLAIVGLSQVELTMSLDRPKLESESQEDAFAGLRAAVNRLRLPAYEPPLGELYGLASKIIPLEAKVECMRARGSELFAGDMPARYPQLLERVEFVRFFRDQPQLPAETMRTIHSLLVICAMLKPDGDRHDRAKAIDAVIDLFKGKDNELTRAGARMSDALEMLATAGIVPGSKEWKDARRFVKHVGSRIRDFLVDERSFVDSQLLPAERAALLESALGNSNRPSLRADVEPGMAMLALYLRTDSRDRADGWDGMRMRLELEGYRPPWIHRYVGNGSETPEAEIAADYYEAVRKSGLHQSQQFRRALRRYSLADSKED
jgi:hypothetical protein